MDPLHEVQAGPSQLGRNSRIGQRHQRTIPRGGSVGVPHRGRSERPRPSRQIHAAAWNAEVQWSTYARLTAGNAVPHVAAQGQAPPDRPTVELAVPTIDAGPVATMVVVPVPDCGRACAELLTEPTTPAWGGEVRAFVRDPDGHLIEINERLT
jgi:hypothetical protein